VVGVHGASRRLFEGGKNNDGFPAPEQAGEKGRLLLAAPRSDQEVDLSLNPNCEVTYQVGDSTYESFVHFFINPKELLSSRSF